jgi:hypothetical protein
MIGNCIPAPGDEALPNWYILPILSISDLARFLPLFFPSAVSSARFWWQEGQVQRCLQEKATNISCWQSGQRMRAKRSMIGRQKPYLG